MILLPRFTLFSEMGGVDEFIEFSRRQLIKFEHWPDIRGNERFDVGLFRKDLTLLFKLLNPAKMTF